MKSQKYNQTDFFLAPTLEHAKGLLFGHLRELKRKTGLNFEIKNEPAGVFFPNGARLLFRGAKDLDDLGALVGYPTSMLWVDECQDIRDEVLQYIQNKVGPALRDLNGRIIFSGTPGRVSAGLWYEIASGKRNNWTNYHWSLFDNPHLSEESRNLETILRDEGYTVDTPAFKREYMGIWVEDDSLIVYAYDAAKNGVYQFGTELSDSHVWHHVIGVDFGYSPDPSACVTLAYSHTHPDVFLVDEFKANNLTYTELWERGIEPMWRKYGPCVAVADAASPQAIAELNARWGIGLQPCVKGNKKSSKASWVELMNADFIRGNIQIPPESSTAREMAELVWDPDKFPERKEHPRRDNHLCDATLYAYIRSKHWHQEARVQDAPILDAEARYGWELAQYARRATLNDKPKDWANDADFYGNTESPGLGKS
jgi:phage terminase large subunit